MNYTSSRYLGSTVTAGATASGSTYASHTQRRPHSTCWMELAVYDSFPAVPSLAGTRTQAAATLSESLATSTKAAGQAANGSPLQLTFELFDDESPVACANFRRLCAGGCCGAVAPPWQPRSAVFAYQDLVPCYRGTSLHKIIPGFCVQGGDLTMRLLPTTTGSPTYRSSNQFSGVPARRAAFADENKRRRHNEAGLLSMANTGPNSNGTQFFITTSGEHEQALNGRHVCFGRVTSGLDRLLAEVAPCGDVKGKPTKYIVVVDCGDGAPPAEDEQAMTGDATTAAAAAGGGGAAGTGEEEGGGALSQENAATTTTTTTARHEDNSPAAAATAGVVQADVLVVEEKTRDGDGGTADAAAKVADVEEDNLKGSAKGEQQQRQQETDKGSAAATAAPKLKSALRTGPSHTTKRATIVM